MIIKKIHFLNSLRADFVNVNLSVDELNYSVFYSFHTCITMDESLQDYS